MPVENIPAGYGYMESWMGHNFETIQNYQLLTAN